MRRRASLEGWRYEKQPLRGGRQKRFEVASLPTDVRLAWEKQVAAEAPVQPADLPPSLQPYMNAPAWNRRIADDRAAVLEIIFGNGKPPEVAVLLYNEDPAHADLRSRLGQITLRTVYRWRAAHQERGLSGLLTGYGATGSRKLTPEMKADIATMVWERWPRATSHIYTFLRHKFGLVPSYRTVHRYLLSYTEAHREALMFKFRLNVWRHNDMLSWGDASAKADHPNHYWEADTTPADLLCLDGRRRKVIAFVDIYSRRAVCRLVPKEDAAAVAATLRKALLLWGLPDVLLMDNGMVYHKSKHIMRVCKELRVATPWLPVRAPERKPHVERFFRTLSEGLFAELPGYTGNSLLTRPDEIKLEIEAEELQRLLDAWVERLYHETVHSEVGQRPRERGHLLGHILRRVDERELDLLLMRREERVVRQGVVRLQERVYYHPDLPNGERVELAVDDLDAGHVYVYWRDKFLCEAIDPAARGIPVEEIVQARKRQIKAIKAKLAAVQELHKPGPVDARIRDLLEARGAVLPAVLPARAEQKTLPTYRETIEALAAQAKPAEPAAPDPEASERPWFTSEMQRYEWCLRRRCLGLPLGEEWDDEGFMARFEESSLYESLQGYFGGIKDQLLRRRANG